MFNTLIDVFCHTQQILHWNSETDEYHDPSPETSVWKRVIDTETGYHYYYNRETKEVTPFSVVHPENPDWEYKLNLETAQNPQPEGENSSIAGKYGKYGSWAAGGALLMGKTKWLFMGLKLAKFMPLLSMVASTGKHQ